MSDVKRIVTNLMSKFLKGVIDLTVKFARTIGTRGGKRLRMAGDGAQGGSAEGDDEITGRKREEGHRSCHTWTRTDDRSPVARLEKDDRLWVVVGSRESRGQESLFFFGCVFSTEKLESKALIIFCADPSHLKKGPNQ
ncbi:unnamed protein product [Lactuca saligna]|uniref:Uncharacterized protein n=1 Tax=Lactuca saligna TaxID=75948 RepID=A0AA35YVF6_LACSI|nr:unnamed protein product [Lactuca saligna]